MHQNMKRRKSENAIIIFQKNLVQGKVKTRLAASLGHPQALEIYKDLIAFTYRQLREITDADIWVFYSEFFEEIEGNFRNQIRGKMIQEGADLGKRMENAFTTIFGFGYKKAVLIGTDCPEITPIILENALISLQNYEVVIGPALDGGYYLIGMGKVFPSLFYQIPWSTENVFPITLERINQANVSHFTLPVLSDIDAEEDWIKFKNLIKDN